MVFLNLLSVFKAWSIPFYVLIIARLAFLCLTWNRDNREVTWHRIISSTCILNVSYDISIENEFPTDIYCLKDTGRGLRREQIAAITFIRQLSPMVSSFEHATIL